MPRKAKPVNDEVLPPASEADLEQIKSSSKVSLTARRGTLQRKPAINGEVPMVSHSSLHPEKLNMLRFSERKKTLDDEHISVWRLLLYVTIVVVIGIGLTLLVQAYFRNQNNQPSNTPAPVSNPVSNPTTSGAVTINEVVVADNTAVPAIGTNFIQADQTVGTKPTLVADGLTKLNYSRYTSVERLTWNFTTAAPQAQAVIKYAANDKTLYIEFPNLKTTVADLATGKEVLKTVNSTVLVKTVQNTTVVDDRLRFSIYLGEAVSYSTQYANNNQLILDIKVATTATTPTPPPTSTTPPASTGEQTLAALLADPARPAEPFYDNTYSKQPQYVSSPYRGSDLRIWNYTYRDYGDRYEFKFRIKHQNGKTRGIERTNIKSYLNNDAANPKLIVEIYNIRWEILSNYLKSECFDGVGFGNVKKICGKFNADKNMVVYEIHLNKLSDYEIDAVDNTEFDPSREGEVIWIKIKDN